MPSSSLTLSKRRRTFVRLIGEIRHALATALSEEAIARRLTRAEMARILEKDRSAITKALNGDSNMTLATLADLAYALDRPVKISMPSRHAADGANQLFSQPRIQPVAPGHFSNAVPSLSVAGV